MLFPQVFGSLGRNPCRRTLFRWQTRIRYLHPMAIDRSSSRSRSCPAAPIRAPFIDVKACLKPAINLKNRPSVAQSLLLLKFQVWVSAQAYLPR